ncbi:putative ABC transport system permease protein [Lacrimispora xylanisolvens]|jgi:putative ABC transport system permease protein|uniref:Putative ABC transport system permease protein n=1 Tax=Lacrimispora xylanisolvens TaxID=384636 RepID=A0A2S6HVA2_9FIRM|nr:ABC transporter permease [Paenibacillaceae bacterium]MBE5989642.1 ABC transporter permease [Paenibacillaceae bacterium]MBE5992154.1 ABC transporter permease [Paenibacillaceae bacterium]PPK81881.1 putative ABC transport system permease protein [Hungatella xylanolytica]
MSIILGVLEEGLVYAIMALGVYITYKILDFPDLSVDGTFPLGGAVTVTLILAGINPLATLFIAFAIGALAGCITGFIHVKLKVRDLLSGIIVMTALYSVNLRVAGKANVPFFNVSTIFENSLVNRLFPASLSGVTVVVILAVIVFVVKFILDQYLKTRSGYLLRAVGDNETLVTSLAKDRGMVKIVGLAIANGLAALAGSVYCQQKGFFEISMGTGTIVIGLANVIIGTKLFKRIGFVKSTTAVIIGSIIYKACVSFAIFLGMEASDLKLITSVLFLAILVLSNGREKKVKA